MSHLSLAVAAAVAVEATRRRLYAPEVPARPGRRRAARALQALAVRLDPSLIPRPQLGH